MYPALSVQTAQSGGLISLAVHLLVALTGHANANASDFPFKIVYM